MEIFLNGGQDIHIKDYEINPDTTWITTSMWNGLNRLKFNFNEIYHDITINFDIVAWKKIYNSKIPYQEEFPTPYNTLNSFEKLVLLRFIRPDKILESIRMYIIQTIGKKFVESLTFDLIDAISDATNITPILFILSPGANPIHLLEKYAYDMHMKDSMNSLSLGQGQGPIAALMIEKAIKNGSWVLLQNCHLCPSWMPTLESIVDHLDSSTVHPNFRLWLTSYPSTSFPILILQNGIKLTTQAPKGLKANLLNTYNREPLSNDNFYQSCELSIELKRMSYALSFFHAVLQERCEYGSIGFNIPYGFNETDQNISLLQLHMFLDIKDQDIPYKALRYLIGQCNYGGRVTDNQDRILLLALLDQFINSKIHDPDFKYNDTYQIPYISSSSSSSN